jgi:hypothetical protein
MRKLGIGNYELGMGIYGNSGILDSSFNSQFLIPDS